MLSEKRGAGGGQILLLCDLEGRRKAGSMKKDKEVQEERSVYSVDPYLACLSFQSMAGQRVYIQNVKTILLFSQDARTRPEMQPEQVTSGFLCAQHPDSSSAFPSDAFRPFIRIPNIVY